MLPAIIALGAAAVLGGGIWLGLRWLSSSPRFALRQLEVEGGAHVTREEILARAGIEMGQNVFSLPLREAEERIRENPWVSEVRMERRLPDGVAIAISERTAAAMVQADGRLYLVDPMGRPFKRAFIDRGEGAGLLVISGVDRSLFRADPAAATALAGYALRVVADWRVAPDRPAIGEVHLGRDGVTLYTLEGATAIAVGRGERSAFDRFDDVWNALSPDERAVARTIYLNGRTRTGRAVVTLGTATR